MQTVSAMSLDPSGARLVTGSYDYDLKIWDFGGMKSDFKPFRSFESRAGHQVSSLNSLLHTLTRTKGS